MYNEIVEALNEAADVLEEGTIYRHAGKANDRMFFDNHQRDLRKARDSAADPKERARLDKVYKKSISSDFSAAEKDAKTTAAQINKKEHVAKLRELQNALNYDTQPDPASRKYIDAIRKDQYESRTGKCNPRGEACGNREGCCGK